MKRFAQPAVLLGTLLIFGQRVAAQVPDESVVPQWSATFKVLEKAAETNFASLTVNKVRPSGPLTDAELTNGVTSPIPVVPTLEGGDYCNVTRLANIPTYQCFFTPSGPLATDMRQDFVRLVRLVEKATGTPFSIAPFVYVKPDNEHRRVTSSRKSGVWVTVEENWYPSGFSYPNFGSKNLQVLVAAPIPASPNGVDTSPLASTSGASVIDQILKSGRYSEMPTAQRVSSSGTGPASVKISNDTAYVLDLVYEGRSPVSVTIPARDTQTIQLPEGSFRVLGRVSAPGVLPFVGTETFGPGDNWAISFFIR